MHARDEGTKRDKSSDDIIRTSRIHCRAGGTIDFCDSRTRSFLNERRIWAPRVVVTADHTIQKDDDIRITAPNGSTHAAELAGRDPSTDLAVLRVHDLDAPVVARADGGSLKPGNTILAVGRFKDSVSAAFGIVSSVSGPSQTWRGGRLDQVVRLDVALHAGAAGGAVVDADGKLIGIATPALSRVAVFAIPIATIERVTENLLAHGRIPRGYLGIGLQPIAIPEHLRSKLSFTISGGIDCH